MSMNYANTLKNGPQNLTDQKVSHPSALLGQTHTMNPTVLKAPQRMEIREREGKSQAVQNMVNQTIVAQNKLLVFKPI